MYLTELSPAVPRTPVDLCNKGGGAETDQGEGMHQASDKGHAQGAGPAPTRYTLYYWPIPFRGEFIRAALALAEQSWDEPGMDEVTELKLMPTKAQPIPLMAPPVLLDHRNDVALAQMPAILMYLGLEHGLLPQKPSDVALTQKILCDANDVLDELTLFGGRSMWTLGEWQSFVEDRLPRWLDIFEETLRLQGVTEKSPFLFGAAAPGLADVTVAVLWGVMTTKLPRMAHCLQAHAPLTAQFVRHVLSVPELQRLRHDSDARFGDVYCGGQIEASIRDMLDRHGVFVMD